MLLQFPYFNKQAFPGPAPFLERLDRFLGDLPRGPRYAVELRNRAWIKPPVVEICRAHEVPLVAAAGRPSSSSSVGKRSTARNCPRTRAPAGRRPGQRSMRGTFSVES